mmetsp:Transcript_2649/g.3844  ORF Transcript_2649/g.3844 Transcript_2649/m.3844 type:complete len:158 (+) Transcript_2649:820-1293(+)
MIRAICAYALAIKPARAMLKLFQIDLCLLMYGIGCKLFFIMKNCPTSKERIRTILKEYSQLVIVFAASATTKKERVNRYPDRRKGNDSNARSAESKNVKVEGSLDAWRFVRDNLELEEKLKSGWKQDYSSGVKDEELIAAISAAKNWHQKQSAKRRT